MTQAPRVRASDRDPRRANGITASGTMRRTNRSDTWPHQPAMRRDCSSLPTEGRPHMGRKPRIAESGGNVGFHLVCPPNGALFPSHARQATSSPSRRIGGVRPARGSRFGVASAVSERRGIVAPVGLTRRVGGVSRSRRGRISPRPPFQCKPCQLAVRRTQWKPWSAPCYRRAHHDRIPVRPAPHARRARLHPPDDRRGRAGRAGGASRSCRAMSGSTRPRRRCMSAISSRSCCCAACSRPGTSRSC